MIVVKKTDFEVAEQNRNFAWRLLSNLSEKQGIHEGATCDSFV